MNRVTRILGPSAVLLAAASASATVFTYTGGNALSNGWKQTGNWGGASYPGESAANDTAVINKSTAANGDFPVFLKADLNYALYDLKMADGDSSNPVGLDVDTGVTIVVNSGLLIGLTAAPTYAEKIGVGAITAAGMVIDASSADANDEHVTFRHADGTINATTSLVMEASSSYNAEARLIVDAANLNPDSLLLFGGNSTSRECDLDINAAFAVTDNSGTDTFFDGGFLKIDVANSVTANFKDVWCVPMDTMTLNVATNSSGQFVTNEFLVLAATDFNPLVVTKEGAGTIDAGSFKITGQSSNAATFEVKAGTLETR